MGWWISRDGEIAPNPDHYTYLLAHPERFGLKKAQVKGAGIMEREALLDHALTQGWIRVRGTRPHLAFEVAIFDPNTLFNIRQFLVKTKVARDEKLMIEEAATTASWYKPASWVLDDEALAVVRNPRRKPRLKLRAAARR